MGEHSGNRRGAPRRLDLTWKLKLVDALLWLGGGRIDITGATRAVSQIRADFFTDPAFAVPDIGLDTAFSQLPPHAGALHAIASGDDTISEVSWNELEAEAQRVVARSYPADLHTRSGSKAEKRRVGHLRTVRRRLLAQRRLQASLAAPGKTRTNVANANALRQAYYQRSPGEHAPDADVVWELVVDAPAATVWFGACSGTWTLG